MTTTRYFWSYLAQFLLEWKMLQTKVVEEIKVHILCSYFFVVENHAVYEIMWKNIVERGRPQMAIWRMCIVCWIPKATNTHSQYEKRIAFLLQQRLNERASMLRYTYSVYCAVRTGSLTAMHGGLCLVCVKGSRIACCCVSLSQRQLVLSPPVYANRRLLNCRCIVVAPCTAKSSV